MSENTAIKEKKAKAGILAYAKALGVLVSPVLAYFMIDAYQNLKEVNAGFASLQTEVSEMRDREMDSFRRNLVTMKRDVDEIKIQLGILEGLYGARLWDVEDEEAPGRPEGPDPELEALRAEIERLQEERDYYEEFEQYEQMRQEPNMPAQKK